MAPRTQRPARKTASAAIVPMNQATCESNGGLWLGNQCVMEATISLRVFKGNPCQGPLITTIVKASNPALKGLAGIALKNME